MRERNFILLIINVIVLISACIQQNKTEKFLSYERNSTFNDIVYGYRINYSSGWIIRNDTDWVEGITTVFVPSNEKDLENPSHIFFVFVSRPDYPRTLDDLTEFLLKDSCDSDIKLENTTVGSLPAHKLKCFKDSIESTQPSLKIDKIFISQVYTVKKIEIFGRDGVIAARAGYIAKWDKYSDYLDIADKMINSFEIT